MGYSLIWLAVKDKTKSSLLEELNLSETTQKEDFPESDITGMPLPSGWYLISINKIDEKYLDKNLLTFLSKDCKLITCLVEETVMVSTAQSWENGKLAWEVVHDSQQGLLHLTTQGDLPENFNSIKTKKIKEQEAEGGEDAGVDIIIEIPLLLAESITDYKHDAFSDEQAEIKFTVLAASESDAEKPWWQFW